jgi:pyridoxal phosphate enzyme (YggS family)
MTGTDAQTVPGTLRERYELVRARIAEAAARSGRTAEQVLLVVVSKTASVEQIHELIGLGCRDLGESRVQQLVQRAAQVGEHLTRRHELSGGTVPEVRWHMVGSLQRNKVRKAVEACRLVHSVDNLRLAEEIHVQGARRERPVDVLVEVNVSGEESKHGIAPPALRHFVDQLDTMVNVRARGMMCMGPLGASADEVRSVFSRAREIFEDVRHSGAGGNTFDLLSMGMSGDYEIAVECGANVVRVGGAVIGPPQVEDPDEG